MPSQYGMSRLSRCLKCGRQADLRTESREVHRRHTFLESVENRWGVIFIIFSLYCRLRRRDAQESGWPIGRWCRPRGPMPKIGSGGRPGAARPADRPVDARLKRPHNVPREGTSHILFPPSRRRRRPVAQESGGSIAGWYGPMGVMPFHRSRGRPTAGEASDRSGVVVRHTTTSRVLRG